MIPRCIPLLASVMVIATAPAATDPLVELSSALKRLRAHDTYAWETTLGPGHVATYVSTTLVADEVYPKGAPAVKNVKWIPAVIRGTTDRRLGTAIEAPVSRNPEFSVALHVITREGRSVVRLYDTWMTAAEMEKRYAGKPPLPVSLPASALELRNGSWSALHTARVEFALRAPADELDFLLEGSNPPMQMGPTLVATLKEETAKKFLHELRDREGPGISDVPARRANGAMTIWLKEGEVVKYEVAITGTFPDRDAELKKITTLSQFDQASVEMPRAALQALER